MSRLGGKSGGGGAGGAGGAAGRIGVRGPGEKKLETDRRRIRERVRKIQSAIEEVRRQRAAGARVVMTRSPQEPYRRSGRGYGEWLRAKRRAARHRCHRGLYQRWEVHAVQFAQPRRSVGLLSHVCNP